MTQSLSLEEYEEQAGSKFRVRVTTLRKERGNVSNVASQAFKDVCKAVS